MEVGKVNKRISKIITEMMKIKWMNVKIGMWKVNPGIEDEEFE